MSLCDAVSIIAAEVESQLDSLTLEESERLTILKSMPRYLHGMQLDNFIIAYQSTYLDQENRQRTSYRAIECVAALAFAHSKGECSHDEKKTTYYKMLIALNRMGINIRSRVNIS